MKIRNMLVAGALLTGFTAAPVLAQTSYVGGNTEVKGGTQERPAPTDVEGANESRGLPITGGDVAGLTAIGLASVGAGTVLVRRSRRRPATA
jgi:LPXTG-motif cell wall-anchored protein